jgi:hypothetical protein
VCGKQVPGVGLPQNQETERNDDDGRNGQRDQQPEQVKNVVLPFQETGDEQVKIGVDRKSESGVDNYCTNQNVGLRTEFVIRNNVKHDERKYNAGNPEQNMSGIF